MYRINSLICTCLYREVFDPVEAAEEQHEPLSAILSELHVRQSNELLSGQLTMLPGLLLEQLQQLSKLVLSRLHTQQPGQGRPQGLPGK